MSQIGGVQSWCLGVTLQLMLAAVLHQGFATVAPPTTAQTTAAPHKEPGRPEKGIYHVTSSNGTTCLLASMGLQLNITFSSVSQNKTVQDVVNLQPNVTVSSGSCDSESASLRLTTDAEKTNLTFFFSLNATSNKYHLSGVSLSALWPDMKGPFSAHNRSLDYLRGTLGYSYMCRKEQTLNVAQDLSINTFQVQVQPFGLTGDNFGAAEECQLDEDDMLIPIIVGAALAGLVLIVLLAYLIGRKRSHAGYQTI
ncbi:lysosome-associated membrane glycoprotein 1b [Morone saxatilis]|uniref:lysosome-associated membrane glycoprotein 1b n=1 Tax=Morone saxatilis TaxID=34816 RepID=UPI0015E256FF|nr:lysosome-associated membrane glycoprotein 1b [Morone saxatilis]